MRLRGSSNLRRPCALRRVKLPFVPIHPAAEALQLHGERLLDLELEEEQADPAT